MVSSLDGIPLASAPVMRIALTIVATLTALSFGCGDPEGPGATGTISLSPGVDPASFRSLAIRVFPDANLDYDPATAPPRPLPAATGLDQALGASVEFPYRYAVGDAIGKTSSAEWRMVAWLARAGGVITGVESGDVFCTVRFQIPSCGAMGDFCGHTHAVDCTLEKVAP
jgi:hypothetical protein